MTSSSCRSTVGLATGALVAVLSAEVPYAAAAEPEASLEEVVVSARRREESLQQTPVSIVAFSGADLESRQIATVADVGRFAPNVSFDAGAALAGGSNAVTVFIRGVGQTDFNLTVDPGVGLYVDGVYVSRSVGALLDTAAIEQVQILRGPQGTLFGKNTIGGAVVLTSRRPGDTLAFAADVATGRYGRVDVKTVLDVPFGERLRGLFSIARFTRDGYVRRLSDGGEMGDRDQWSGRATLEWDALDALTLNLTVDAMRARERAAGIELLTVDENGLFAVTHNIFQNATTCAPGVPGRGTDPRCYTDRWVTDTDYTTFAGDRNASDTDVRGAALTATWRAGWGEIKSITAYRELDSSFLLDADGSPLAIASTANDYRQDQLSQELQFTGTSFDERLKWLAGLYLLRERGTDRNSLDWSIGAAVSGGSVDNDSAAAFAQLTWSLTPAASLSAGLRYTDESKRFTPDQSLLAFDPTVSAVLFGAGLTDLSGQPLTAGDLLLPRIEAETSAREVTPSVTVDYRITDAAFAYATFSRGFKSGGFTQRVFPPLPAAPSFDPEFVDNYEVGIKTELFDRRMRLNLAAFTMNYTDLQITVTRFVAPTIENAGKARSRGAELDFEARPFGALRVAGGIGYTDADYRRVPANAAPVTVSSRLPNAPRWTGTLAMAADVARIGSGLLRAHADWSYKGEHYKDAANSAALRQGGYGLLGANLTWESDAARWVLSAGVTNVADKRYLVTGNADLSGGGYAYGIFGRPREWFLSIGYRVD